jgi:hypothetical protein
LRPKTPANDGPIDADGFQRQSALGPRANRRKGNAYDESDRQHSARHAFLLRPRNLEIPGSRFAQE